MSVSRVFEDKAAVRERTPLLIGLVGPSSSGKTYSALRLATGIQRVAGGEIGFIDTEARRALHYADKFNFRHLPFGAPFGPLDYLAAIEHFAGKGVQTIVIDSASHEHEGPGGVLEMHDTETKRLAKLWNTSEDKAKMAGWQKPKSERRRLLNSLLQMPINFIFCFRAKEKIDLNGSKPRPLGWMPIAGEEFVFEMTLNCLLYPGSDGVPTWQTEEMGERSIIKLPGQFRDFFPKGKQLDEATGESLAKWAAGTTTARAPEAAPVGGATAEQIEEIGIEFKRLGWKPGECAAWLKREFNVDTRAKLTEAQATQAAVRLIDTGRNP